MRHVITPERLYYLKAPFPQGIHYPVIKLLSAPAVRRGCFALAVWLSGSYGVVLAADGNAPLVLLIQPTLNQEQTRKTYQPLADYLSAATGRPITLLTRPNFFAHWQTVQRNTGYDLVLDDAHFTDYRIQKFHFQALAKFPGTTSYGIVVAHNNRVLDPLQLAGKKIASFGPPSLGAALLSAMFPNPSRRPALVEIGAAQEGFELLSQGKVSAAMLPATIIGEQLAHGAVTLLIGTEPTPAMALSATPRLDPALLKKIRQALLGATASLDGRQMLRQIGIERFEGATAETYTNQAKILKEYWGY